MAKVISTYVCDEYKLWKPKHKLQWLLITFYVNKYSKELNTIKTNIASCNGILCLEKTNLNLKKYLNDSLTDVNILWH